ncbi:MAG: hypothetical protein P1U65_02670 [Minwuia sp.]|nr:hypothetical protein [Minwuia sp.]
MADRPYGIVLADTITSLPAEAAGAVVVCGSHGGVFPAACAIKAGVRAVILNDAGVGRDQAGIGGLDLCLSHGMAAATVNAMSCRIGDAADMLQRGRIGHVNALALTVGVRPGMSVEDAAEALLLAPVSDLPGTAPDETREEIALPDARRRIVIMDSASLVKPDDDGQIVVTASHGALVGGNKTYAIRCAVYAALFNDAGGGPEGWGFSRLSALDERRIAGATVSAASARIGDGRSTYDDGILSAVNDVARFMGLRIGMTAQDACELLALSDVRDPL